MTVATRESETKRSGAAEEIGQTERCVHEIFEYRAESAPDVVAVISGSDELSYGDLNRCANQLAWHLRSRGAEREVVVGVFSEPSLGAAIASVAILKTGAACLPLQPSYPDDQLIQMLRASRARIVVATRKLAPRIARSGVESIILDHGRWREERDVNLCSRMTLRDAAFVRFTSGTTGVPKCVVNIHQSLTCRVSAMIPDMLPGDRSALNTSTGLGIRLLIPLCHGATVVVLGDDEARDSARFLAFLRRNEITSVHVVPSFLREFVELGPKALGKLDRLRVIAVGGETLTPELACLCRQILPQVLLVNLYGCSETGGVATAHSMGRCSWDSPRSIGTPIGDTRIHILDNELRSVPPGTTGEIYVESSHLARGYVNCPDLTAERFVANPFVTGGRLYRTSDLGRYLPDGDIEFIGRVDDQVKIRGFRVEPTEIEAVLLSAPNVKEAAVAARSIDGDVRLFAWVVPKREGTVTGTQLRRFLADRLPAHMVPSAFLEIERLPLTQAGKLDRKALISAQMIKPPVSNSAQPPLNRIEASVAAIWAEALHVSSVGIHDQFLDLGGDSLSASRIISKIEHAFGVAISLGSTFDHFTVAELAAEISFTVGDELNK